MTATDSIYGPSWYAATMVAAPEREPLAYDLDVDVCVIGGGLAGLTVARELARRDWSVAVLEAKRLAWNASGRNAGFVAPGFAERPDRIIERVGLERARALWLLSAGGVDYVRTTIRETQMPGVGPVEGWLNVQRVDDYDKVRALGALIGEKFGTEVEIWSTEHVRAVLRSRAYFQALHFPGGFHIHPLNYALGLAAAAEEAGARIFEETPALAIDPAGVRKRIDTPKARVRADHVVLAGSAHLAPLMPMVSEAVLPVATYSVTTAPLGERLMEAITYPGAVVDTRRAGDYYRIVDGDRLLWGGRMTSRLTVPRRLAKLMRGDILKIYPQLGDVEISHAWAGVMGYAVHKMPQIGEVSRGLWVTSAFGGHGLNTTAMAGELIARAIADGDDRWRLFSSYDLVYAGGRIGRAAAQVLYWAMQVRDMIDQQLARQRAAAGRRQEVLAARAAEETKRRMASEAAQFASEQADHQAATEAERRATLKIVRRPAEQAAYSAVHEAEGRSTDLAAHQAALLAEEEARRQAEDMAARLAAEARERLAEEEESFAADNAARLAQEEAERRAAEEAAYFAAQEAEWQAVERAAQQAALIAQEEKAARLEAERQAEERAAQQAARTAEENAKRRAEAKVARLAAEDAARRVAEEAARIAAEAERRAAPDAAPPAMDDAAPVLSEKPVRGTASRAGKSRRQMPRAHNLWDAPSAEPGDPSPQRSATSHSDTEARSPGDASPVEDAQATDRVGRRPRRALKPPAKGSARASTRRPEE